MNAVEMVKEICKQKNIPISRLERECGFSNGYISKLKKGCFPIDKAERIANYLNLDVNILAGVQRPVQEVYYYDKETLEMAQELFKNKELRLLFDATKDIDRNDLYLVYDLVKRMKRTNRDE